jgi:hypothetical protein
MKTREAIPEKIDLYHLNKADYAAKRQPAFVDLKPVMYLAIRGQGAPGGPVFQERIGALYGVAFTVKLTRKFAGRQDYAVCKLEAQYFFDADPTGIPKDQWCWRLLIRTPDFVGQADLDQAVVALRSKGKPAAVAEVKRETIAEGRCVQMLHVGPYERERETIAVMMEFAAKHDLTLTGPHHEIYLSDPRRVAPEKLKTILRLPTRPA